MDVETVRRGSRASRAPRVTDLFGSGREKIVPNDDLMVVEIIWRGTDSLASSEGNCVAEECISISVVDWPDCSKMVVKTQAKPSQALFWCLLDYQRVQS